MFCHVTEGKVTNKTLTLGFLLPWEKGWSAGPFLGSAIILGIKEVQNRQLLPGYELKWVMRDDYCNPRRGMQVAVDLWHTEHLSGIIGTTCSVVCQPVALLAAAWGLPVVGWGCSSVSLSNKQVYPTFTRVLNSNLGRAPPIAGVAARFHMDRICIISTPEDIYKHLAQTLFTEIQHQGMYVELHTVDSTVRGEEIIEDKMDTLKKIFGSLVNRFSLIVLLTYPIDFRNMLISAYDVGMLNGEYGFMFLEYGLGIIDTPQTYRPEMDEFIYEGLMAIGPSWPSSIEWDEFRQDVIDTLQDPRFEHLPHLPPDANIDQAHEYAGMYGVPIQIGIMG
jgi:hypothetical protein